MPELPGAAAVARAVSAARNHLSPEDVSKLENLAKNSGYNAFVVFGIYSDLEICYKELYNFEKAYLYSTKRMSMLEGFKS